MFNSIFFDKYAPYLSVVNVIGWIGIVVLGIQWGTFWWILVPASVFMSYRWGMKSAMQTELATLQMLESQGKLKDIHGNPMSVNQALQLKIEGAKMRASGKY